MLVSPTSYKHYSSSLFADSRKQEQLAQVPMPRFRVTSCAVNCARDRCSEGSVYPSFCISFLHVRLFHSRSPYLSFSRIIRMVVLSLQRKFSLAKSYH